VSPTADQSHEQPASGRVLAEITNAIVRLHRTHYGKGPTRSKSYLIDDVLICVMREIFTTVERTLIDAGEDDMVRQTRLAFQEAMQDTFKSAIEEILGRPVLGITSQVLIDRDTAIEVFVLGPGNRAGDGPAGDERAAGRADSSVRRRAD
jgi:uncharacterized protein YbcI